MRAKLKQLAEKTGNRVGLVYSQLHDDWTVTLIHHDGYLSVHTADEPEDALDKADREVERHLMEDVPCARREVIPMRAYARCG